MSGHGRSHSGGHGHSHSHEDLEGAERGNLFSLYLKIDTEKVECLNEESEGSGKDVFKPWDQRLDTEKVILHYRSEYERLLGNFDSVADREGGAEGAMPSPAL